MISVLITGVGSATGISVIKALKVQSPVGKIRIIGTDINKKHEIAGSSFCDVFYKVPKATHSSYIKEIVKICKKEKVQILFPIIDPEILEISKNISAFEKLGCRPWTSGFETVTTCNDKYKTYEFLKKHSFLTPETWLLSKCTKFHQKLPYPLIIKPRDGVGSTHVYRIDCPEDFKTFSNKVENAIVQKYIGGKEITIDIIADQNSHLMAAVPRERIEVKAGISYKGKTLRLPGLNPQISHLVSALKIIGPCNVQCKIDKNQIYFIEINPRFSAALPLTTAAGVNSPLILIKLALGQKIKHTELKYKSGVYMARYWEEVFYGK